MKGGHCWLVVFVQEVAILWFTPQYCNVVQYGAISNNKADLLRLNSYFWVKQMKPWLPPSKGLFNGLPRPCSLWAWLNASSFTDVWLRHGVMRYGLQGYPLSPRSKPSSNVRGWDSNLWPINELLNTKLSSVLPGHRATMFVNVPKEISTINFVLYCVIP